MEAVVSNGHSGSSSSSKKEVNGLASEVLDDDDVPFLQQLHNQRRQRHADGGSIDSDDEPLISLFQNDPKEEVQVIVGESEGSMDAEVDDDKGEMPRERDFEKHVEQQKLARLKFLLDKTSLYSTFLQQKLALPDKDVAGDEEHIEPKNEGKEGDVKELTNGKKRKRGSKEVKENIKKGKTEKEESPRKEASSTYFTAFQQPKLVTGGDMRNYQLQGVEWLVSLYENGLNGILADEMGLGKTVQCIAFFAHLIDKGVSGPFLVAAPLSTLANWAKEVVRWCPTVQCLLYHGSKEAREEMRKKKLNARKLKEIPIIITSYEIVMKDRKYLQRFKWKYIVVDEGHRIKNLNCKLIRELKSYTSANRLLLTGTPLQNKLSELWSMLNFLLPDIFDDLDSFQSWFDFDEQLKTQKEGASSIMKKQEENQIVTKLHQILRPFLLRRVKNDVELDMPSKKEKIIYTKLSDIQAKYYHAILDNKFISILSEQAIKNMKNQGTSPQMNMLMQLRKCCNHPFLFEWPHNKAGEEIIDESLIQSSGKMQLLDRLLPRLQSEGHRVLIFSQMTKVMDILEDYMNLRKFRHCRIDGSTPQEEREEQIDAFNKPGSEYFCFLLSTRAGGLGINLTSADTVVFYDNDWNPQMDLQAQDRCHRIGQTKPVRIYRLATANSIESRILECQDGKMKLERLVIQKGNFVGVQAKSSITAEILKDLLEDVSGTDAGNVQDVSDDTLFNW